MMTYLNLRMPIIYAILNQKKRFVSNLLTKAIDLRKCYQILEVTPDSSTESIRSAYIELVKKFHPDSGSRFADKDKFAEIDEAFKTLMQSRKEQWQLHEESLHEVDIKHTAPQHRQYLSYEGYGSGNPFEREKQYIKYRAAQAAENVLKHRISKVAAEENAIMLKQSKKPLQHDVKTKYGLERLVEDLIQESMSKGEFSNLRGSGKPLENQNRNPYVDFTTHKMNEVLIDNGFVPEWITLQKEIKADIKELRTALVSERIKFGEYPFKTEEEQNEWIETIYKYDAQMRELNKKVDKYNLVVPILDKQMVRFDLFKEAESLLAFDIPESLKIKEREPPKERVVEKNPYLNMFGLIESLFKKAA